eukprot:CAMPEP_0203742922 /NCGR_PEP_ID=MMETSP0092-20131115/59172_1 /ASSEMBLY_ACC=CAM_ASM_001090 /TAXON_ID=426623 /ORGANISM="Chaetoceros affinis, Strain CCMP159" /LENGTH=254 /DNA_ID=CAMNT_0050630195 /DNA_START=48 /DNA_END=810 /DNA_ORIENTATION=+
MSHTAWEQKAKEYPWHTRTIPPEFSTPQQNDPWGITKCPCIEWWNTRSPLFCCLFPCSNCYTGAKVVDGTDHTVWKEQLEKFQNGPESMRGVWWLKYNHAHEELVTIFNDTTFLGETNDDGTDGYGRWERSLGTNWSRDNSCFGHILVLNAKATGAKVGGLYNLKDGILTLDPGMQWVFRVDDNDGVHYEGDIGEEGEQKYNFIYQWLKVIDKDGEPTEVHYEGDIGEEGEQKYNFIYQWLKVIDKDGEPTEHW